MNLATLTHHAVEEYPTDNGPADYALFVKGKLFGIIEAKKVTVAPQNVLEQAKRYSRGVTDGIGKWNGFGVLSFMRPTAKSYFILSILAKAFRGELVPQDPNDPPASELLAQIKRLKENQHAQTSKRRKATSAGR